MSDGFKDTPRDRRRPAPSVDRPHDNRSAHKPLCGGADQNLIAGRGVLKPSSGRHYRPHDDITQCRTRPGNDYVTGLHTRTRPVLHALDRGRIAVQRMHRSAYFEHSANGTQCVVFVRSREAEEPDQFVAQGPLDARTMTLENFSSDTRRARPHASDRLRVNAEIRCWRDINGGDRDCSALARKPRWCLAAGKHLRFRRSLQLKRRVLTQYRSLESSQRRARLEPQFLEEQGTRIAKHVEGFRLPSGAIQRNHEEASEPLPERIPRNGLVKPADKLRVEAESQLGLEPILDRLDPIFLQHDDRALSERFVHEIGERRATPQRESGRQRRGAAFQRPAASLVKQSLEPGGVYRVRIDRQAVRIPCRLQDVRRLARRALGLEGFPQPRHQTLHDRRGGRRRISAPELIDEPLGSNRLPRMERQEC